FLMNSTLPSVLPLSTTRISWQSPAYRTASTTEGRHSARRCLPSQFTIRIVALAPSLCAFVPSCFLNHKVREAQTEAITIPRLTSTSSGNSNTTYGSTRSFDLMQDMRRGLRASASFRLGQVLSGVRSREPSILVESLAFYRGRRWSVKDRLQYLQS